MFKVIYKKTQCKYTVYSVYYHTNSFLIFANGKFMWVDIRECELCE